MNRRIFRNQTVPHVLWQPRMEPWFSWHRQFGELSRQWDGKTVLDFYDALDCSMRYVHYYTHQPNPITVEYDPAVVIEQRTSGGKRHIVYRTPMGDLEMGLEWTVDRTWRTVRFPVATVDGLKAFRWLCRHMTYHYDEDSFLVGRAYVGERGEPQFWVPKSPYQALAQQWMTLPNLICALADDPKQVEATMAAIDDSYDALYEELTACPSLHILNFGENIHDQLISPAYWERYFVPFYEKRCAQLHKAGVYSHGHIDGFFHSLLPYLADIPWDGIEALTPTPQGDVTLDELAESIGDKVLLDGIPAVLFMPQYSMDELMGAVERIVDLFAPRLILGISDELPQGTDESVLDRVRAISTWCREHPNTGRRSPSGA